MGKQLKILAVDDDFINLKLISSMLRKNPHVGVIIEATNGLDAINLLKMQGDIDLVLLDIKMPVMDGIEATSRIRELPGGHEVKIVAVTASAFMEQRAQLLEAGMDEYVCKPSK